MGMSGTQLKILTWGLRERDSSHKVLHRPPGSRDLVKRASRTSSVGRRLTLFYEMFIYLCKLQIVIKMNFLLQAAKIVSHSSR